MSTREEAEVRPQALRLEEVSVAYGPALALEKIDGGVAPGEAVALIGPNGAGKSTLIKAILGLVPLAAGRVTVLGTSPAQARRDVAYVPQADTLDPEFPISVGQVVLMGRYRRIGWLRRPKAADKQAAHRALEQVGLADRARHRFGTLSGGQRQRVLLARAIAAEPRLLLLDEPFNGVDAVSEQALLDAIAALKKQGAAVVVATHDLALAHLACEEVCLLDRKQFGFGPTRATLTPDRLRATYGGHALELRGDRVIVAHS
ncbi:metal ABC transporter ATP-binding protein [Actinomadura soli]|uniref:Metal ABC transporter ATP-binding protein n=1 Tax=Actinomadura soli TaxID=2508997 RepID=A0A5C4J8L3_9ACTN|nr:metal ABC transporter ATP-binding protein [Actinomadura soli]TMQ92910.1 metal ABC transporter ATP-binding protein [Actinomadura soli]